MFERKDNSKNKKYLKLIGVFSIILNALGVIFILVNPKRWQKFVKGQKKELTELRTGKEDFKRFRYDSSKLLQDLFIPHELNGHKPFILRPKSLLSLALTAIAIKLVVVSFLFFSYPSPAQLSAIISTNVISLINQSRVEAGVEPLQENEYLDEYAYAKGQDMIENNYFAHDTPDGKRPWQWINRGNYDYVYAGENLAMDFVSAEVVHDAFMKSPSHRRNILNPKYQDVGIAVINGELDGHKTILLVQFFGTQRQDIVPLALTDENLEVEKTDELTAIEAQPNLDILGAGTANEGVIVVTTQNQTGKSLIHLIIEYSNILFIAFLLFLFMSLMLNIFIKVRVQHTSVIFQSLVVIALLASLVLVKFHFVEQIAPQILIL